jgi:3-oxoacyl-(acyl-carrier-protein) synthase
MKAGVLDAVVVVSVDDGTCEDYLSIFGEFGLSKLVAEEAYPKLQKFRCGQGCNISVFETGYASWYHEHKPLAKVEDMYIGAEVHNTPLGISADGKGYRKVMNRVFTDKIDFVKTHSTFSADNQIEDKLIKEKFGDIRTINYKLRIGHTMGASTAIETALAVQEESGRFLSLGAGMGNVFSAAVLEICK